MLSKRETLDLAGAPVSDAGIEKLRKALSKPQIYL